MGVYARILLISACDLLAFGVKQRDGDPSGSGVHADEDR
jgi:hypothetical protein